jgi:hypothetical protein
MTTPVVPIIFGGLIAWGIYRRVRRNLGRQKLRPVRHVFSIAIFSIVSLVLLGVSELLPKLVSGFGIGLLIGAVLGFVGLRLTKFETTAEGNFYTPDPRIGMAIVLVFTGRMIYRFWSLRHLVGDAPPPPFKSALTYLTFGLLAGYYIVFYAGLLRHSRKNAA